MLPPDLQGARRADLGRACASSPTTSRARRSRSPRSRRCGRTRTGAAHQQLLSVIDDKGNGGLDRRRRRDARPRARSWPESAIRSGFRAASPRSCRPTRRSSRSCGRTSSRPSRTVAQAAAHTRLVADRDTLGALRARDLPRPGLAARGAALGRLRLRARRRDGAVRARIGGECDRRLARRHATAEPAVERRGRSAPHCSSRPPGGGRLRIVIILAAWLAGPTSLATAIRREITPYFRQPLFAYGALAAPAAADLLVGPHPGDPQAWPVAAADRLLAIGFEFMRRQVSASSPTR